MASEKRLQIFCEYEEAPIGIDINPRFSWNYVEKMVGRQQKAYRINIKEDGGESVWDTGWCTSSESLNIEYKGKELKSNALYIYQIIVKTDKGEFASGTSAFRTGMLKESDWKAKWIRPKMDLYSGRVFREVQIKKTIKSAVAYVTGIGYYEFSINGNKIGDKLMSPAVTDYSKTVLYDCFDVSNELVNGINVLAIELGNGWSNRLMSDNNIATDMIGAYLQLEILYNDGEKETVVTEPHAWKSVGKGDLEFNSLCKGVVIDATQLDNRWKIPGFEKAHPDKVFYTELMEGPEGKLMCQRLEPERIVEHIRPVRVDDRMDGSMIVDFGVNYSGYPIVRLHEEKGTRVEFTFAEVLKKNGELDMNSYAWNAPKDTYICSGDEDEIFEPRFTCHAFRYMQIKGLENKISAEDITGCVIHNDVQKKGFFTSGNPVINKMQEVVERTETNNLHAVPTDCPHRERAGWLNDMTGRAEQAAYNYDLINLYTKWVRDIRNTQGEKTGSIADMAPYFHGPRNGAPVNSSYLIVPWLMYLHNNDRRILEENYEGMKKWEGYLTSISENNLIPYAHYGDWCQPAPYTIKDQWGIGAQSATTPGPLIASAYYYYNAVLLGKMAEVMEEIPDVRYYRGLAEKIREAFNAKWLDRSTGNYATGSQACNAIALWMGIVPQEYREQTAQRLSEDVIAKDYHLSTGNLCTKYLIEVLFQYHYEQVAYRLLTQTTYPSWGFMFENGATTYWERWEYDDADQRGMESYDHPMQGSACSAFHNCLAGIRPSEKKPGFAEIFIHPYPVRDIGFVKDCLRTKRGEVKSEWSFEENGIYHQNCSIPFNCTAKVWIPFHPDQSVYIDGCILYQNGCITHDKDREIYVECIEDGCLKIDITSGNYEFTVR